jgi:hypothetical protein
MKRDFAAGDVAVRGEDLPADAIFAGAEALRLRSEGVGWGVFGGGERLCCGVGLDESEAGAGGVDAHVETQLDGDGGTRDGAVDRGTGFQEDGVGDGRGGHQLHGEGGERTSGEQHFVTWAYHSLLRAKDGSRRSLR